MPASERCFAVPPVDRISTPRDRSALASSMIPLLSETERIARSIRIRNHASGTHRCGGPDVAAGFPPDVVIDIDDVGDRMRVADRCDAERGGAVVEVDGGVPRPATKIFFSHQRRESRSPMQGAIEILRQR